jgi:YHS domain-containing protein
MLIEDLLWLILSAVIVRAVWRLVDGVLHGMTARPSSRGAGVPARGVQMVRDPVCGTYVLPERAVSLTHGSRQVYFCSAACRDKYRAHPADSGPSDRVRGRTA